MLRFYTPLRYPGGKQKLYEFIEEIIDGNDLAGCHYIEPYAGGAGVAIQLLIQNKVSVIHLNDINPGVYSFWYCVKNYPEELCRKISLASINVEEWRRQKEIFKEQDKKNKIDLGFAFLYLNRCNRSGIINAGVIGGLNQNGEYKIDARFSRKELISRIELIAKYSDKIKLKNLDAKEYITTYLERVPDKALVYLDPPYMNKSENLYYNKYNENDHKEIANVIAKYIKKPWIVSYDNNLKINEYYSKYRKIAYSLHYNAAKSYDGSEVFIFSEKVKIPRTSRIRSVNNALKAYF